MASQAPDTRNWRQTARIEPVPNDADFDFMLVFQRNKSYKRVAVTRDQLGAIEDEIDRLIDEGLYE